MEIKKYVAGFLFSSDRSRVALIHKTHGPAAVVGKWNGIGGKRNLDNCPPESADAAMWREFCEEAGTGAGLNCHWTKFLVLQGVGWQVDFFHALDSARLAEVRTAEVEEVRIFLVIETAYLAAIEDDETEPK